MRCVWRCCCQTTRLSTDRSRNHSRSTERIRITFSTTQQQKPRLSFESRGDGKGALGSLLFCRFADELANCPRADFPRAGEDNRLAAASDYGDFALVLAGFQLAF